ncbi:hypothetical protein Tco_0590919, partial [Tanacetum coccineum]
MASESASTTTGVGSTSALTIREIIPTNRTPEVWKDFNMCIMTNGQKKAQCKYCFHFFSEGSNTTLKNHITHPHCEVLKAQQNQNPEAGQTSMGRDGQIFMYNPDYLREQFAGLVIQRGLPFNHFDHEQTTRVFQNTMQPRYTHVSRSTLKRDAMKLWVAAKQATIDGFGNLNNKCMCTRSSLEYTIPRRRNRRRSRQQQEAIPIVDKYPIQMADDRPMAEQLQAPTGGFESAIV